MRELTQLEAEITNQPYPDTSSTDNDGPPSPPKFTGIPDGLTVEIEGEWFTIKDGQLVAVDDETKVTPTMAEFLRNLTRAQKRLPWLFAQGVRVSKHRASHTPHDMRKSRNRAHNKVAKQARKTNRAR